MLSTSRWLMRVSMIQSPYEFWCGGPESTRSCVAPSLSPSFRQSTVVGSVLHRPAGEVRPITCATSKYPELAGVRGLVVVSALVVVAEEWLPAPLEQAVKASTRAVKIIADDRAVMR
jgi:hypothetical protein